MRQRCHVSCVTWASNWYWLTFEQGLLSLQQVRVEGGFFFYFFCFFTVIHFRFCPAPSLSSPLQSLLSLFSLSLGEDPKWPTRVDVSLNPNTINQRSMMLKNHFWQNDSHFNLAIYVPPYVCMYWFPQSQSEGNNNFKETIILIHCFLVSRRQLLPCRGYLISTAYWHFLFWKF